MLFSWGRYLRQRLSNSLEGLIKHKMLGPIGDSDTAGVGARESAFTHSQAGGPPRGAWYQPSSE